MPGKILVYIITALCTMGLVYYLFKKYRLSSYQFAIFILLTLFWSANVVVRAYRKSYAVNPAALGGLDLGFARGAVIASGYGFISIFARGIMLYLSDHWKSKKKVIGIGLISMLLTSAWVYFSPDFSSLLASSLALGVAASMLSLFNLFFAETFPDDEALLSVSILSVAPLLAEFVMSSFQFSFTITGEENYPALWLLSLIFSAIGLVFLWRLREPAPSAQKQMNKEAFFRVVKNRNLWIFAILGVLISLIRFSTSGSNIITYFQSDPVQMPAFFVAYSDFVYAIAQLLAGVLVGTYFSRRWGLKRSLLLGMLCGSIFNFLLLVTRDANLLFYASMLQGFSYGISYNALIGLTMLTVERELRSMSMAFFQTFFALGIFYGDMIYKHIADLFAGASEANMYHYVFRCIFAISLAVMVFIAIFIKEEALKPESSDGEA